MPNITTNHAITYTNYGKCCVSSDNCRDSKNTNNNNNNNNNNSENNDSHNHHHNNGSNEDKGGEGIQFLSKTQ